MGQGPASRPGVHQAHLRAQLDGTAPGWPCRARVKGVSWVDPVAVLIYGPNVLYRVILDGSCWLVISFFTDSGAPGEPSEQS